MRNYTTTEIGRFGENAAANYLEKQGYRIVERNYRASHNEIDLIAENKDTLIFVEVKTRTPYEGNYDYGTPADAVTYAKQKRTIAAARAYLYKSNCDKLLRFDVIEVYLEKTPRLFQKLVLKKINHIPDAFSIC